MTPADFAGRVSEARPDGRGVVKTRYYRWYPEGMGHAEIRWDCGVCEKTSGWRRHSMSNEEIRAALDAHVLAEHGVAA